MECVLISVNNKCKVENYITEYELNVFSNTTVIIFNNTKSISEKHYENFVKCPNVFWWLSLVTLQELKSQRLGVSVRLAIICTQNAGEKLNEQMESWSHIEEL